MVKPRFKYLTPREEVYMTLIERNLHKAVHKYCRKTRYFIHTCMYVRHTSTYVCYDKQLFTYLLF